MGLQRQPAPDLRRRAFVFSRQRRQACARGVEQWTAASFHLPGGGERRGPGPWLRMRIVNIEKRQLLVDERVGQLRKEIQDLGQRDEQVVAEVSETRRALGQELQTIAGKLDSLRIWQAELKGYGAMLVMATAAVMAVVQLGAQWWLRG